MGKSETGKDGYRHFVLRGEELLKRSRAQISSPAPTTSRSTKRYSQSEEIIKLSSFNPLQLNGDFLRTLRERPFENIVGKGDNSGNQHLLLSQKVFFPVKDNFNVLRNVKLSLANAFNLDKANNVACSKSLRYAL